jgi:hypothetical protein
MSFFRVVYPQSLTHELFNKPEGYQLTGTEAWKYFKANYAVSPTEVHDAGVDLINKLLHTSLSHLVFKKMLLTHCFSGVPTNLAWGMQLNIFC